MYHLATIWQLFSFNLLTIDLGQIISAVLSSSAYNFTPASSATCNFTPASSWSAFSSFTPASSSAFTCGHTVTQPGEKACICSILVLCQWTKHDFIHYDTVTLQSFCKYDWANTDVIIYINIALCWWNWVLLNTFTYI